MTNAVAPLDSHVHVSLAKYSPLEDFLPYLQSFGMDRAVLVQHLGNPDNTYLAECLSRFPGRFAAVGIVDVSLPAAIDHLRRWVRERGISGLRVAPVTEVANARAGALWDAIDELGLVASVTGPLDTLIEEPFRHVVRAHPGLTFRLEHLGWLRYATEPPPYRRFRRFLALAELPNTLTMWSGFSVNSEGYPYRDALPYLEMSYQAFGARRIMWSGDWNRPVITESAYRDEIALVADAFPVKSDDDVEWILRRTAEETFSFDRQPELPLRGS